MLHDGDGRQCFAIVAPSFPAAFLDVSPWCIVGALRSAGFDGVYETAFGADLVSYEYYKRYREILEEGSEDFLISSPCPAVVSYIEKLHPELLQHLVPVLTPMETMGKLLRETVFWVRIFSTPAMTWRLC